MIVFGGAFLFLLSVIVVVYLADRTRKMDQSKLDEGKST